MLQFMADIVQFKMGQGSYDWREVEAILFCFYSIVESCEPEGDFIRKVCLNDSIIGFFITLILYKLYKLYTTFRSLSYCQS